MIEIVVLGAAGRMGRMVLEACAAKSESITVAAAIDIQDSLEAVLKSGQVIIDFTTPESSMAALEIAERVGAGYVLCTTGFTAEQKGRIEKASRKIPILMSPNMSIGVNVLFKVAEQVARTLGFDFDVEIIEAHHNQKKDAPSGTALGFSEAVAKGLDVALDEKAVYGRQGMTGARPKGEIGIHAVRGGDIAGDHTVLFAGDGERVEIRHVAHGRKIFAQGAVRAAFFLKDRKPGLYTMADVLGL